MKAMTEPQPVRRRSALGMSGWLLFVCLFLPTLRVCNDPMMPVQFPPTYGIYLVGLLIGLIGFTTIRRSRHGLFIAIATIYIATAFGFLALFLAAEISDVAGVIAAFPLLGVLIMAVRQMTRTTWSERAVAVACVIHAVVSIGWSSLLAFDPDGMWGAWVSLFAASLMLFASIGYWFGAAADARDAVDPMPLPAARVVT
jgi:hypothetical protein